MLGDVLLVRSGRATSDTAGESVSARWNRYDTMEARVQERDSSRREATSDSAWQEGPTPNAAARLMPPLYECRAASTNVKGEDIMWHSHVPRMYRREDSIRSSAEGRAAVIEAEGR